MVYCIVIHHTIKILRKLIYALPQKNVYIIDAHTYCSELIGYPIQLRIYFTLISMVR